MSITWGTDSQLSEEEFYNRKEDLEFIGDILNSTQYGSAPSILLTGVRGVGKTALINQLKNRFKEDYLVISLDLTNSDEYQEGNFTRSSFMKLLYYETMKASSEHFKLETSIERVKKYFKTQDIKIVDEIISYEDIPIPIPGFEENYQKLAHYIMELPQEIYNKHPDKIKGVFIFIDEFQIIKNIDNMDNFLWYIRSKVQSQKNVAYLFSGSMNMKDSLIADVTGKKGAFGGRMLTINVEPFSYETTKSYINDRMEGLDFTEEGLERFYKCTRGIPAYINIFSKLISKNMTLDEERVLYEFERSLPLLANDLTNQWYRLTYQEQKIIVQLIEKPLKRIEIANNLNITSGSLSKPLIYLQEEYLIELNDDGKYQIIDPILSHWLKQIYKTRGVYPYRGI